MNAKEQIRYIQIFNQRQEMVVECTKGYSFPAKTENGKIVDNVLMLKGNDFPLLAISDNVEVIIATSSGQKVKYFCSVDYSTSKKLVIMLNAARAKSHEEKRRYYRIKTAINCRVVDVTRNNNVNNFSPNLYGKIYDINIGGVLLVIDGEDNFETNDIISFTAVLGSSRLEISAKVLRTKLAADGETLGYMCSFVGVSTRQEEMISSYINYLQIEDRRLKTEMKKMTSPPSNKE